MKNKVLVVAYGVVEPSMEGQKYHGNDIPGGYAKVGVDRVADDWGDLELEMPGGDGEKYLCEAIHGWILRPKSDIRIPDANPPTLGSSLQGSRARSLTPPPVHREYSLILPDQDPSMSPPPPPPPPQKKRPSSPHPQKKQRKLKEKPPPSKKAYEMTEEEIDERVAAELKAHFGPKSQVELPKRVDRL